jgi:hypothetical protein
VPVDYRQVLQVYTTGMKKMDINVEVFEIEGDLPPLIRSAA